jgi:hypothetical protein
MTETIEAQYTERYVAFLDLLGFKALVAAAEREEAEQQRLEEVLDRLSQTLCNNPRFGSRFTYFSDCIIITADPTPETLWDLFRSIGTLTRNLLQFDVFVRGGVTRGGSFHTAQYVYGTAISRAAVIEKDLAKSPLTLLSSEVYADVERLGVDFLQWLETDGADRHFVHYLLDFAEYHRTPALPGKVVLDTDAERIAFHISRRLLNDTGRVLEKAQWFQSYWNRTVSRPHGYGPIEANSALSEPDDPRTTIRQRLVATDTQ